MQSPQAQQEAQVCQEWYESLGDEFSGFTPAMAAFAAWKARAALSQSPQPASQPVELTERKDLEECCEMLDELRWSSEESADPAYVELRGRIRASSARAWTLLYAAPQPEPADTKDATCPHCGKSINWMCHGIAMKDTRP